MRGHRFFPIVAATLLLAAPAAGQLEGVGLTTANGCEVYTGQGVGQMLTPLTQTPLVDVGRIDLQRLGGSRTLTFVYEAVSFLPTAAAGGTAAAYSGYANWRILENGARGTNRYELIATPNDPTAPTQFDLVLEGEVLRGNRWKVGGSNAHGVLNAVTGSYMIDVFTIVLCRDR